MKKLYSLSDMEEPVRRPTRKSAKAAADKWYNKYIVKRGQGVCVLCGSTERPTCGHVIAKAQGDAVRYDEMNTFVQCWGHNYEHTFRPHKYISWFIANKGLEAWEELTIRAEKIVKYTTADFLAIASKYKAKCEELEKR